MKVVDLKGVNVRRFQRECNVMRKLVNHDNVLKVYDQFLNTEDNMGFIVLELGCTDFHSHLTKIHQDALPFDPLSFFKDLVSAIFACHQLGYIHGDIKLENIILVLDPDTGVGSFKIGDFGYVRRIRETRGSVYGSVTYSAPESFATRMYTPEKYDRTLLDVWALGVVLYTTVAGADPFDVDDTKLTISRIVKHHPSIPNEWDDEIKWILRRTLEKNPSRRISMRELYEYTILNL